MPLYKYEVVVDLPDDANTIQGVLTGIHLAICNGSDSTDEEGAVTHACGRNWSMSVHGFVPLNFDPPAEPDKPEIVWDEDEAMVNEGSPENWTN